jgi:hypothetical protein
MGAGKFAKMGDIRGMSVAEIKKKVGSPSSISNNSDGTLLQWIKTGIFGGYHFAIKFDREGKAVGFTHQHLSGPFVKFK